MKQSEEKIVPIGTKVKVESHVPIYASKEAIVVGVERGFKDYDEQTGTFIEDGLLTVEGTIKSIAIPYDFDGEILKVHHKDFTRVAKYYDSYYTVRVLDMDQLVLMSGDSFTVISKPTKLEQTLIQYLIELHESVGAHLPVYLRGVIYAYDVTDYRNLPQLNITDEQWLDKNFKYHIKDRGFLSIFESEIILTETNFTQAKPLAVLIFNG